MVADSRNNNLRLLLVDDDVDFVASLAGILELEGYPVETAHTVSEATAKMSEFEPDVALIDFRIGNESGFELIRKLHGVKPELTCVVVTAYSDTKTAIDALKAGAYDFLRKPFESGELFAVLRRCYERHQLIAEKVSSEKALKESESRFRIAFETSPDSIILARPGGEIIDANPGFEQMTGYRREKVIGRNSQEVGLWKNPEDRNRLLEQLEKFGQVDNMEAEFRLSDGRIRIGLMSARIVHLDGEPNGLFVVRDIHEIKEKEKAIMESEERFRGLVGNIPGAVFRCQLDHERTMLYISSPISEISGYPATGFVNNRTRSFRSVIHPDDAENVMLNVRQAFAGKKPYSIEYRIVHADGSLRWVLERGRGISRQEGTVECVDGVILDITEGKRTLQQLAESQQELEVLHQEYRTVLEGITDAIFLVDREMNIVWANQGAVENFPLDRSKMPAVNISEAWHEAGARALEGVKWVFDSGTPIEILLKKGNGKSWGVKFFPVKTADRKTSSVILIASDLTEKIRLRDQATRSAHLAALGELAAGVAHEINNPTGMILLDIQMLRDALKDLLPLLEEHVDNLADRELGGLPFDRFCQEVPLVMDEIYEGAERIKRIVEELKDFSRPSTGELTTVDLNEVVRKSVRLVRNPLKKATDHFTEIYWAEPLLFSGNSQRLEQVMVNLLLNACYALPDRTRGIHVETRLRSDRDCVQVLISDEGVGIEPDVLKQITDPFFTTRRESGGTGLGLSVSSRIIDEHHGLLAFDSEPGKGTTVTVELPVLEKNYADER